MSDHAIFQLTIKALVHKENKILLLNTPDFFYDFPGGRVDNSETDLDLKEVLSRELKEELGTNFLFKVNDLAFVTKRRYNKHDHDHWVIAIFYNVDYLDGTITLSKEHAKSEWINPKDILDKKDRFMTLDEYSNYANYFK